MKTQEIGLYRMAKEKKAMNEAKEMTEKSAVMTNAIIMANKLTKKK